MTDSSFESAGAINQLEDVTLAATGTIDQVIGWNGTKWADTDPRSFAPAIPVALTNRYYFPRAWNDGSNYYPETAGLTAIKFNKTVTVNKWVFAYSGNGTIAAGNTGVKVRGFIYQAGSSTRPHTLTKDLGYELVKASNDTGGLSSEVRQVTLGSTVTLNANTVYYVGCATYPVNRATHTDSASPSFLVHTQENLGNFWNNGINPLAFGFGTTGMYVGAYYNAATTWSAFDFASGTLPDSIENAVGTLHHAIRIGLSVSAIA
jgi:hypothetical protein